MTHRPIDEPLRPVRPHPAEAHWTEPPEPGQVDPAVLSALLHRHGWQRRGGAAGRYGRWTPPGPGGSGTSLLVPENRAFPDSDDLLGEALDALSRSGSPSARDVLVALAVPSDEIRWWRDVPAGPVGVTPWSVEERLRSAARQMLLAAALATRARAGLLRRPVPQARRRVPGERPRRRRTGRTAGSPPSCPWTPAGRWPYACTRRCTPPARPSTTSGPPAAWTPSTRPSRRASATNSPRPSSPSYAAPRAPASPSSGRPRPAVPEGCAAPDEAVEFSPGDVPVLREAAARYLREEPSVPVRITGAVVRIRRSEPRGEGTVRLRVIAGAEVPYVRVTLDEEAYRIAGQAHLVGLPVRVHGRLESRGGFRRLTDASGVVPVQVDEAERDRLMKSLQENLDFFEEACSGD